MKNKTALGLVILALAVLFLNPIPGPDDALILPIYSLYSGADISLDNVPAIYLDYFVWCSVIGLVLLFLAMNFLGWDLNRLFKKFDLGKYKIMVLLAIGVVILVAYLDIQGMIYWASFSSTSSYINGQQGMKFWNFFKSIALSIFLILPITYYFVVNRDKSEAFSIWSTSYLLWMFGFADVLFFVLQKSKIPEILPWLTNHPVIGSVSRTLGFPQVTNLSLIISVVIGFILVFITNKILKERF